MKRAWFILSLVAVANLAGVAALVVLGASRGWLESQRLRNAYRALRGEEPAGTASAVAARREEPPSPLPSAQQISEAAARVDVYRTVMDRRRREIEDGWKLLETQQLALLREREAFEEQKKREAELEQVRARQSAGDGARKELEILAGLKAKEAKELLRLKADADVVALITQMPSRAAGKIVAACRTSEERSWIGRILEQVRGRDASQAEVLGAAKQPD